MTADEIRARSASDLTLPSTPRNLDNMTRDQLLREYDRLGDYWAVWLDKAVMLPETYDDYTDKQLRAVIALASSVWARQNWIYHDYAEYPDEHTTFYDEFFKRWDELLGKSPRKRVRRRPTRRKSTRRDSRQRSRINKKSYSRASRPSPSISAAAQAVGFTAIGNDGNKYVVKADKRGVKKWIKHR